MNRSVMTVAMAAAMVPALVAMAGADAPAQAPATPDQPSVQPGTPAQTATPAAAPSNTNPDGTLKVVVHKDRAPEHAADARVDMGGVKVSMPSETPGAPAPAAASHGMIAVPMNTIGPGEPMWIVRERENAERKIAQARAEVAESIAEHTDVHHSHYDGYSTFGNGYFLRPGFWSDGWFAGGGLRGPVTTTTTYSDQLGTTAQRAYSEAAYPRLNGSQDAHDRAVQQFGRDSTPPISRIQNDVDAAHRNANTERRPK